MELDVAERLVLLQLLRDVEGDLTTLRIIRDLKASLSFSEEEHKVHNFRQENGLSFWDHPDKTKDVDIGDKAMEMVRKRINELSAMKKLHIDALTVCERFLEEPDDA